MRRRFLVLVGLTAVVAVMSFSSALASAKPIGEYAVVPIVVFKSKHDGVAAFAKVIIRGRAFAFLIDTGASTTLINPTIAKRLHLRSIGKPRKFCGVTSCSVARRVRLVHWSIDGVALPPSVVSSAPIFGITGVGFGLLGSDVLSKFGAVTLDYANHTLTLG